MEVLEATKSRRAIRQYLPDPVEREKLRQVLEAGRWAGSGSNEQNWDYVIVTEQPLRQWLAGFISEWDRLYFGEILNTPLPPKELEEHVANTRLRMSQVPVFILPCCNQKRPMHQAGHRQDSLFWSILSLATGIENMMLAAHSLGLASNWMGLSSAMEPALKAKFGIPDEVRVLGIVSLGYPGEHPIPRQRFPLAEMVHVNQWGNPWTEG